MHRSARRSPCPHPMLRACALLAALAAAGCGRNDAAIDAGPAARRPMLVFPTNVATLAADTVLVRANGKELTLGQANREIAERFASASQKLPPEEWARRQPEHLQAVADQFVMRTILLGEADRRGIRLSAQDASNAFERVRQQLPGDKTLEQVLKESPLGEERMREEVLVGARINKLFSEALPPSPVATDQDVAEFMEAHPDLKTPETVTASHILIKVAPGDSEEARKVKRAKIEALRKKLLEGADFAQTARDNSQCKSASRGGALGTFRRGQILPEFEAAAFSQKTGEVGKVVETKLGYHLIKVSAHRESAPVPPDRMRVLAQKELGRKAYEAFLKELKDKARIEIGPFHAAGGGR